ncbi:MAG: hypothetical protein M3Q29_04875 [Chloroflexota bacterium]|nr:hypothetical protein [Chloroflexota bacterium]
MDEQTQADTITAPDAGQRLERAIERYRELLVAANPDAVPELITGADTEELDRSLETAKAAFARAREAARSELAAVPSPTNPLRRDLPPAGLDAAGPLAKIAWGLREGSRN